MPDGPADSSWERKSPDLTGSHRLASPVVSVTTSATWRDEAWKRTALDWVDERLALSGPRRKGEIEEIKIRPWSLVWRVPTEDGQVWFKANGGQTLYEPALVDALARWVPGRTVTPLAIDAERGWMLAPEAGPILRETPAAADPRRWEAFVAEYGQLQRDLSGRVPDMLALGVPDHRPEVLPEQAVALVDDPDVVALDPVDRERVRAILPEYALRCATLAAGGIGASLNHDDLHDANVLVRDHRFEFFDWGDAAVAHPFATMLVTLRVVADKFDVPANDPVVTRVRDAYLEVWSDAHDAAHLRELARLAAWTGIVGRSYSWRRGLAHANAAELAEWGDGIGGWLTELL